MQRRTAGRRAHVLDEAAFISTPPPQLRRRTNTDGATSPVPLTPYTGNQHAGYPSAGSQKTYFNLNDEDTTGPSGLVVKGDVVRRLQRIGKQLMDGLEDASRVDRSLAAIQRDKELRAHVIKSTVINLVALSSIIVFDLLLLPTLGHNHASPFAAARTRRVRLAFDILWKYPVFGFCFWINTFWSRTISKRALNLQPSSSRGNTTSALPETDSADLTDRFIALLPRFLIIGTHTTIGLILSQVPWIGRPISLVITCLVDAYYCFEPSFKTRGYSLYDIGKYFFNGRAAYFIGFGIVPTLMTAHVPFLASVIIFALIYPICVIQAIQTRSRFVDVSSSVEDGMESPGIESSIPSRGRRTNARGIYKRFLQAFFSAAMLSAKIGGVAGQTYSEELTLKPLANGKMSLLFAFEMEGPSATEHFRLAPPSLLLPLQHNNVSEMHLSLVTGRWKAEQWGQSQHSEIGGTGAELRAWFRDEKADESWKGVTNALAGLFCSSLGQIDPSITAAPEDIFPDSNTEGLSFRHAQLPAENLCTENLTPFLKLLPCKGISGLSALMKPYVLLAHEWHAMAVDYIDDNGVTKLGLRWEAVADMTKGKVEDSRDLDFSVSSIFDRSLPSACPAAVSSRLVVATGTTGTRVIILDDAGAVHPDGGLNWSLGPSLAGKDVKLRVLGHAAPRAVEPITVSRTLIGSTHSNSGFSTIITNNLSVTRRVVYTEELPWWIRLWLSELEIKVAGRTESDVLKGMTLHPSIPRTRPTVLQLQLVVPPQSQIQIRVPFTKEYIRYTEHLPDASRGWELPPAIVFLPEEMDHLAEPNASVNGHVPKLQHGRRTRLYTSKLLVDLPTPDFSMPYNVIIMTSTLIALFFGSVVNLGVRRWGVISLQDKIGSDELKRETEEL